MLQPLCVTCGHIVEGVTGPGGVRCAACFDGYLRSVDAGFLEHWAEFGARSRQVVAESCMRALVLANVGDRKLLGMSIYEQFVGAASDLIALTAALRLRAVAPISRTFMDFRLDADAAARFFADVSRLSGVEFLASLGLPPPETLRPGLPKPIQKDVTRSLRQAVAGFGRLHGFRDLGERALVAASDHFRAGAVNASATGWLAGRELSPGQVASIAVDARRGRLDIAALRVDEARLSQVIDAIDVITGLSRALTYAFVTLHDQRQFVDAFSEAKQVTGEGQWPVASGH